MVSSEWFATLIGFAVTVLPGFGVGHLVRYVGNSLGPLEPPSEELRPQWIKLTSRNMGGWWIGFLERPMFFAAFFIENGWPVFSTWIVMKTAFCWQSTNFSAFPPSLGTKKEADYLVAKHQLGNHRVATVLVGTAANILLALIGVAVANWVK